MVYSNRTAGHPAHLGGWANSYGFTMLAGHGRRQEPDAGLRRGVERHVYFGCTSPDDLYVIFADDPDGGIMDGEMRTRPPGRHAHRRSPELRGPAASFIPQAKGPVLRLQPGFEPHWTYTWLRNPNDPKLEIRDRGTWMTSAK